MKLVIDTATGDLEVSIWGEDLLVAESYPRGRGETLGNWLPEILSQHGISLQDIESVLVGIGPGSFTGLRTGIAFAQGLCALGRPLYAVSTLELLSSRKSASDSILVSMYARPGLWYLGHYEGDKSREWMGTAEEIPDCQLMVIDQGLIEALDPESNHPEIYSWQEKPWMSDGWDPFVFFQEKYLVDPQKGIQPNYIQAPSAEVVLKAKTV